VHEVTFARTIGEQINPCIRVLHRMPAELGGHMTEQVDILGTDDAVHISVPSGFELTPNGSGGYTMTHAPQ
jgi:hypothetical protein